MGASRAPLAFFLLYLFFKNKLH